MPDVPPPCQSLAADVAALEATDQNLRTQLATLVGADAWMALANLGQTRLQLSEKRDNLAVCIRNHSAVLQANLTIFDLAPASDGQPTRVANLWEIASAATTQRETSPVTTNAFSFDGPLPAWFGISVVTTGDNGVVGPDFRSVQLNGASVSAAGPLHIEIVLGPEITIDAAALSQMVSSAFSPITQQVTTGGSAITGDVSVLTADAILDGTGIIMRATGQIEVHGPLAIVDRLPFSGKATLSLMPSVAPASADIVDLISVTDLAIDVPGAVGAVLSALVPAVRGFLSGMLNDQLRKTVRQVLPTVVLQSLVLPALPSNVNLSIRRLQIDPNAITIQPALGAIGTALSTFRAPVIPPP